MAKQRCFILGAGVSTCCGFPVASRLTLPVWRTRAELEPMGNTSSSAAEQPFAPAVLAAERDRNTIRMLFPDMECDPSDEKTWPDFEPLITLLDEAQRFQEAFERSLKREPSTGTREVKEQLLFHLEQWFSNLTANVPEGGLASIKKFVAQVEQENDTIISFNWDTLVEIVAADLGIPVHYRDQDAPGLRMCKPHGSLNLVDSPADDFDDVENSPIRSFKLGIELRYHDQVDRVIVRAEDPRQAWPTQLWAGSRLIVEPNMRKRYDSFWLEYQWCRALRMVRSADVLVVIGFSLPKADIRPRLLFQLAHVDRPKPPRVQLVAPNATKLRKHYKKLTGLRAEPFDMRFEEWVETGR